MAQPREPQMGLTFEQVWAMFQESDRRMREMNEKADRRSEETDRRMREINEKADRRSKETDKKIQEIAQ